MTAFLEKIWRRFHRYRLLTTVAIIVIATVLVSYFHYAVPKHYSVIHISHYYAYYLIVIYAAFKFGFAGGLVVSAIISVIYSPRAYIFLFNFDFPHHILPSMVQVSMLYAVGGLAGFLSSKLIREKSKVEKYSSEMLELEKQLAHDNRLRVMGQLSAGIAHEIRNPLASIKTGVSLIESGKGTEQVIKILQTEIDRLNAFVNKFLQYARMDTNEHESFDLNNFCKELNDFLQLAASKSDIGLTFEILSKRDKIYGDKNALKQAVLNIVINSIEELEGKEGGLVRVKVFDNDSMVEFTISDNGQGISSAQIEKIFEPFFTTKDSGTGLGLAIAMKIAQQHDGDITASSQRDGATFVMTISGEPK